MFSTATSGSEASPDYSTWSTENLVARITELERQLHLQTVHYNNPPAKCSAASILSTQLQPQANVVEGTVHKRAKREGDLPTGDTTRIKPSIRSKSRDIDPSKYHMRFIALKLAYLGQRYNGLEHANGNPTPLPTVEEVLWKALRRTRLIFPLNTRTDEFSQNAVRPLTESFTIDWSGCDYSKAGRTDRGVSAFGQVVALRVRSARPKFHKGCKAQEDHTPADGVEDDPPDKDWDDISDELPYVTLLNAVLPQDIRILAWCPHPPPGFDARFSCRERHYKYFFTQPAFSPTPGAIGLGRGSHAKMGSAKTAYREGWLDIDAMREAAKHFEGKHDFRNFCTLDHSKQISNFERVIHRADIELIDPRTNPLGYIGQAGFQAHRGCPMPMSAEYSETECPGTPLVCVFTLEGNAFLWHQVRHMMSILFLVGQGLEPPSIVPELLDVTKNPGKPVYEMASDTPLVLWDCIYPDLASDSRTDSLDWIYIGDPRMVKANVNTSKRHSQFGSGGIIDELWSIWRQSKMDEILTGALLDLVISRGDQTVVQDGRLRDPEVERSYKQTRVYRGGNSPKVTSHVPIMQQKRSEPVEIRNARWLAGKQQKGKILKGSGKGQLYKEV